MKKIQFAIAIIFLIAISEPCAFGGGTNDDIILASSYERLTGIILRQLKQDHDELMVLHTSDRLLKTKLWLKLLDKINQIRDTSYDRNNPTNAASSNVGLPFDPQNPKKALYFAGTDPSSIEVPEIRAEFEQARRENHKKYIRNRFEHELEKLASDSTTLAVRYFYSAYAKTSSDAKELIESLKTISDETLLTQLKEKLADYIKLLETKN